MRSGGKTEDHESAMRSLAPMHFLRVAWRFAQARSGSIAIEYALIAVIVSAGIFGVVQSVGFGVFVLLESVVAVFTSLF